MAKYEYSEDTDLVIDSEGIRNEPAGQYKTDPEMIRLVFPNIELVRISKQDKQLLYYLVSNKKFTGVYDFMQVSFMTTNYTLHLILRKVMREFEEANQGYLIDYFTKEPRPVRRR